MMALEDQAMAKALVEARDALDKNHITIAPPQ